MLRAVEIVSPASGRTDRVTKLTEYAYAGIPHYWIVDIDEPATLTAYILVDGDYEIVAQATGMASLSEPAAITIDMRSLTSRSGVVKLGLTKALRGARADVRGR